jgi:hypothetical protein
MSIFDNLQDMAFNTVTKTMGVAASWTLSEDPSTTHTGSVLFKKPTEERELADSKVDFNPNIYFIEYKEGVFPGLYELLKANETTETIVIGNTSYDVLFIDALFDGKTYKAYTQVRT